MFGKRKRKVAAAVEIASGVVAVQQALGGAELPTIFSAKDHVALGYVFGAHSAACQVTGIECSSPEGFDVLATGFQSLAGKAGGQILEWCLSMQRDPEFRRGSEMGGQEIFALLKQQKHPTGLAKHLQAQSYAT